MSIIGKKITFGVTVEQQATVIDKYTDAIASGTNEYVSVDYYLVQYESGRTGSIYPRDVTSIVEQEKPKDKLPFSQFMNEYGKFIPIRVKGQLDMMFRYENKYPYEYLEDMKLSDVRRMRNCGKMSVSDFEAFLIKNNLIDRVKSH